VGPHSHGTTRRPAAALAERVVAAAMDEGTVKANGVRYLEEALVVPPVVVVIASAGGFESRRAWSVEWYHWYHWPAVVRLRAPTPRCHEAGYGWQQGLQLVEEASYAVCISCG
jgi:hypothetical protein